MKTFKTLLLFSLLTAANFLTAQNQVKEMVITYENQTYPALQVVLDVNSDFLKKEWKKFVKENYNVKLHGYGFLSNRSTLTAEAKVFKTLDEKRADMYFNVEDGENEMTTAQLFMSLGYDIQVGPDNYSEMYNQLKNDFKTFLNQKVPEYYENSIADIGGEMKDLEKDLKRTEKQISKVKKKSDKALKTIEKNKAENEKLEKKRQENMAVITEQEEKKEKLTKQIGKKKKLLELKRKKLKEVKF